MIKLDCVFGGNWNSQTALEIAAFSRAIQRSPRPLCLSLSPGGAMTMEKLQQVSTLATTARIAVDLHGEFYEVYPQFFDLAAQWHQHVPNASSSGLFLDFDILPFGKGKEMHLSIGEMRIVMTLWCMLRSPLIYGGAVAGANAVPPQILQIVTNRDMLRMTDDIQRPMPLPVQHDHIVMWMAFSASDPLTRYVAVFNVGARTAPDLRQQYLTTAHNLPCITGTEENSTCFHNPKGKIGGMPVRDFGECCKACGNYTGQRPCIALRLPPENNWP